VTYSGPINIPSTRFTVSYTLQITNVSSDTSSAAAFGVRGPTGSFDPFGLAGTTISQTVGEIPPGEMTSVNGVFPYSLSGNIPESRAALTFCLLSVIDAAFLGGEARCSTGNTGNVSNSIETTFRNEASFQVYPNPIEKCFRLQGA